MIDVNKEVAAIIGQLVIENTTLKAQLQVAGSDADAARSERDALAKALEARGQVSAGEPGEGARDSLDARTET